MTPAPPPQPMTSEEAIQYLDAWLILNYGNSLLELSAGRARN